MYQGKVDEAQRLAEAYCGFEVNLNSSTQMGYWLYDVEHLKVQRNKKAKAARSTDKDAIAALRASVCAFDGDYEANNSITQEYVEQRLRDGAPVVGGEGVVWGTERFRNKFIGGGTIFDR